jgi:hypothetical protein
MSVKELQARIDKLAADIDLQKTVLQQLEQSKSAAQRQLNAICDPMTRLPLEISSAIFLLCLPHSHPKPTPCTAPMLLLRVCHAWAEIAVSTPALWVAIRVDVLGVKFLQAWLQRARNYPLSISLRRSFNSRIGILLRQYAKQLKHLKIYDEELDDLDSLTDLESFPCLETLTLGALSDGDTDLDTFSLDHVMGLLRLTPNLVECTFHNVCFDVDSDSEDEYSNINGNEKLVLPELRCLKFGPTADLNDLAGEDCIIRHLTLPAVKTLALPLTQFSTADLSSFLKRSSPPLEKLVLGVGISDLRFQRLADCLRILSSLVHLEFGPDRTSHLVEDLLDALADSPHFLPNLRTLKVVCNLPFPCRPLYQKVLRAVTARCTQLVCLDIRTEYDRDPSALHYMPDADIRVQLRKFAAEGVNSYIGTPSRNMI